MKTFEFIALDKSGKKKIGNVKARSLDEAKRKVQRRGFIWFLFRKVLTMVKALFPSLGN